MFKNNVEGYKCFNRGLICNKDNFQMQEKKLYKINNNIKYHNQGFHFCLRLEDTLRFFGETDNEKVICKIRALGDIDWSFDHYNCYYDMGCTDMIYIEKIMSREEIMKYADNLNDLRFIRFIMGYKLNNDELEYFKNKYRKNNKVDAYIGYYQEKEKNAFVKILNRI